MADKYVPPGGFADISSFVGDGNAINAATKTALNLALTNIFTLFNPGAGVSAAHPDFNRITPAASDKIKNELVVLQAAITAHA
jgi:hypothetical protein